MTQHTTMSFDVIVPLPSGFTSVLDCEYNSSPRRIAERSWAQRLDAYWEATGVGGLFMALGAMLFVLGFKNLVPTPTRIETRTGGLGVILRTKHRGHVPTKSDITRGWKLLVLGTLVGLFGVSITYGPVAVYRALNVIYLKAIS